MDLLKNILAHFSRRKNTQNSATFNDIIVKTVSGDTSVPEASNDIENDNSKPASEDTDISNSKSMEKFENAIEISITNAEFDEVDVASISSNIPPIINNIDSNIKVNIQENLNEIDSFSNKLQDDTNNELSNHLNFDENTMKCIEEFDSIFQSINLQSTLEPVYLDEFEELFQEHRYLLNLDTEETIPVHVINKNEFIKNDTTGSDNRLDIKDDTDIKAEKVKFEIHENVVRNVKLDSTEIGASTELTSVKADDINTETDRNTEIDSTDFEYNSENNNSKILEIDTHVVNENVQLSGQETCLAEFNTNTEISTETENYNKIANRSIEIDSTIVETISKSDISLLETISNIVKDNMQKISQERSLIPFDTIINVDNSQEATVMEFDNATQVDKHLKSSSKEVNDSLMLHTNELENNNECDEKISPIDTDNSNLKVENCTKTIIQHDNKAYQDVKSNITDDKEAILAKVSNLIEITLTKIHNNNNNELNNVQENLEIISISSDDIIDLDTISIISDKTTESDCGYHSSDFEFISENEAKLDGFITNYRPKDIPKTAEENQNNYEPKKSDKTPKIADENQPGPSGLNANNNYESYRNRYARPVLIDRTYRARHEVPEGEGFMDLFRGMYNPAFTSMVENKSIRTNSMLVEFEGIGFERQLLGRRRDSSEDEYENEAQETGKRIHQMYPGENRKRRRRF